MANCIIAGNGGHTSTDVKEAFNIAYSIAENPYTSEYLTRIIPPFVDAPIAATSSVTIDGVTYTASASSAFTQGSYNNYAYKAFDGDYASVPEVGGASWFTPVGALVKDTWLQIEADKILPTPDIVAITYASIHTGDVTCIIQNSIDGETWTNVSDVITLPNTITITNVHTVIVPLIYTSTSASKYRLKFLSAPIEYMHVANTYNLDICEMSFFTYKNIDI